MSIALESNGRTQTDAHSDSQAEPSTTLPEESQAIATDQFDQLTATEQEQQDELRRIKDLPKEVGVMLITVGVMGLALPGLVGTPAVIAGGLVLWPRRFTKIECWFERRFPQLHKQSLSQINRYLDDLDHRFPPEARSDR